MRDASSVPATVTEGWPNAATGKGRSSNSSRHKAGSRCPATCHSPRHSIAERRSKTSAGTASTLARFFEYEPNACSKLIEFEFSVLSWSWLRSSYGPVRQGDVKARQFVGVSARWGRSNQPVTVCVGLGLGQWLGGPATLGEGIAFATRLRSVVVYRTRISSCVFG
jgi:hypothetical protein